MQAGRRKFATTAQPAMTVHQVTPELAETLTDLEVASAGGISLHEIESVEKRIAAKYGLKAARRVLLEALVDRAEGMTPDAVPWVQKRLVAAGSHVGDLQRTLRCYQAGALFVDVNRNGKIDIGSGYDAAEAQFRAGIFPGDEVMFHNPAADPDARIKGRASQHAIYLGEGKWYAHPLGIVTEESIIAYLNQSNIPDCIKMTQMQDMRIRLDEGFLSVDQDPD